MNARTHSCPGYCGERVPHRFLACRLCWRRLPGVLQRQVLDAASRRREDPSGHRAALAAAFVWYRENRPVVGGG